MLSIPQATAALYIKKNTKCFNKFDRYLLIFSKNEQKLVFDSL